MAGKVYLIGAGPGRPDLITARGLNILKQAEVIIYDYLVDPGLFLGLSAKLSRSDGSPDLMVKRAKEGKKVARLKNGDPSIFGRLKEEINALRAANIEFEIVPGVTAGNAAAAYSGTPLTARGFASSVVLATGHEVSGQSTIDWEKIAALPSIVLYMAVENLGSIVDKLLQNKKSPRTPVTVVSCAGSIFQKKVEGSLADIAQKAQKIPAPAIIIIGANKKYDWFKNNRRILFTGLSGEKFFLPGTYFHLPMIEIKPLADYSQLDHRLKNLEMFNWLLFSSRYGVQYFFERLFNLALDARSLAGLKIAAVGRSTASALQNYGVKADLVPKIESADGLSQELKKEGIKQQLVFMPRSNLADKGLEEKLTRLGAHVVSCVAYDNVMPQNLPDLDVSFFDEIMFTSPSAVRNFKKRYKTIPKRVKISWIGEVTRKEVKRVFNK